MYPCTFSFYDFLMRHKNKGHLQNDDRTLPHMTLPRMTFSHAKLTRKIIFFSVLLILG